MRRPIIAAALLSIQPGPAAAQTSAPLLMPGEALVQVSATGDVKAVPDVAEISAGVSTTAADVKGALAADAVKAARLAAAVRAAGVADRAVRTSDLSVRPRYRKDKDGDDTDDLIGYQATNRLTVRVAAREAGNIIDMLGAAGATDITGPQFSFADDAAMNRQARDAAVRNAKQRARDYAEAFGLKTLRVVRVSERRADIDGGSDIVVTGLRVRSPVQPGEQTIGVTVWIDYAMSR